MTRWVLVVEDNPINLELVRALLEAQACEVVAASTGDQALGVLATTRPHLVIMDLQLPGMTGYETTRRIKADPALTDIPVVVLTAHAMRHEEVEAQEAGCDAFLTKPIDVQVFNETLRRFLPQVQ